LTECKRPTRTTGRNTTKTSDTRRKVYIGSATMGRKRVSPRRAQWRLAAQLVRLSKTGCTTSTTGHPPSHG
jgi:hypothetical protein